MNFYYGALALRITRSKRASVSIVVLGFLALLAVFAEMFASDAPILAIGPSDASLLPAIVDAERYEPMSRDEIDFMHADDAVVWPLVRFGPRRQTSEVLQSVSSNHPLGTDALGRDVFARLVYGARTALGLSLGAVLCGMLLGLALGGLAGFYRRFWNDRLVRLVETVETFPAIIVVALVRAIEQQPSELSLVIAVAIVRWAEVARLTRIEVLHAETEDYVLAARALGCSSARIFTRHIFPNVVGPVVVSSVFGVASVVLLEAAISFLEMGGPTQSASWGETLAEGVRHPSSYGLLLMPGIALAVTVGATYLLADALRDAMDPRTVRNHPGERSPLSRVLIADGRPTIELR